MDTSDKQKVKKTSKDSQLDSGAAQSESVAMLEGDSSPTGTEVTREELEINAVH
jgi:hypothetical protein